MFDPDANQKRDNTDLWGFARFGGLDRLDWLMILASVLLGTVAKQHHVLDLPDWFCSASAGNGESVLPLR